MFTLPMHIYSNFVSCSSEQLEQTPILPVSHVAITPTRSLPIQMICYFYCFFLSNPLIMISNLLAEFKLYCDLISTLTISHPTSSKKMAGLGALLFWADVISVSSSAICDLLSQIAPDRCTGPLCLALVPCDCCYQSHRSNVSCKQTMACYK